MNVVGIPRPASNTTQGTVTLHFRGSQIQWSVHPTSVTTDLGILDPPLFVLNPGICPTWRLRSGPVLLGGLDTAGEKVPAPEGSRSSAWGPELQEQTASWSVSSAHTPSEGLGIPWLKLLS